MSEESASLQSVFQEAEVKRKFLESQYDTNSPAYQEKLLSAILQYGQCATLADQIALFSPNESLDDISSSDLKYLLIHYRLADLGLKENGADRRATLRASQSHFERFLRLLDSYEILSKPDAKLLEQYRETPDTFSTTQGSDPALKREIKIRRFKEEKQLKQTLETLQRTPVAQQDEDIVRRAHLASIAYCVHQTFQSLESIGQELHILSLAPSEPQRPQALAGSGTDIRDRSRQQDGYSDRLDAPLSHLSAGLRGPLLDSKGKPMRPFTLLDKRTQMRQGVFRPDHNLPTMTIDEYLEEERRRGGIIEGGGPNSGLRPEVNEDDYDKADEETMKARAWDEFTEENPRGAGNTINRG